MSQYKHRNIESISIFGSRIDFIASNDRITDRVTNISHESHVLDQIIKSVNPDDVFWDIGACLGIHSFTVAKHLPDGQVIGFEPMPSNRSVYLDNKSVNELDNVYVEKRAVSNSDGKEEFAIRESIQAGYGRHGLTVGEYESVKTISVETTTGDTLVQEESVPAPNVVKIDVEGASPLVLEGMRDVLAADSCREVILETHAPNDTQPSHEDFGYTRQDIIDLLESLGFSVSTLGKSYHLHATKTESELAEKLSSAPIDIELVQGDIADETSDVIMNSAGTTLRMGSGVAGALRNAGGEELNREAIMHGPAPLGSAIITDAYELDADAVVHAVSMPHYGDGKSTIDSVQQAVNSALQKADAAEYSTISLPAVGCGLGGVPLSSGAEIILHTLADFSPDHLDSARFVLYTQDEYQTVESLINPDE